MQDLDAKEIDKIKLILLPCREPIAPEYYQFYNSAYQLWKKVWSETLKELDGIERLFSNEFTRHDFATVIFRDDVAISLICFSAVDLKLDARKNDFWFESWPLELLVERAKLDGHGLIASWYCVSPDYRKSKLNSSLNISKLMMEAFGKVVLEGGFNVGYGTTRNNRSVNTLLYEIGGIKCGSSNAHGCEVDLVLLEPARVREVQLSYSTIFKNLWERRMDLRKRENDKKLSRTA